MNYETKFKNDLIQKFKEKKNVRDTSIKLYLRNLEKLNDDMPLKNLKFLQNMDDIKEKLSEYKPNTQRGYIISIVTILSLNKVKNKKIYDEYRKIMDQKNKDLKIIENNNQKSETVKENWVEWSEVQDKINDLQEKVDKFKDNKELTLAQYNILLKYVVLGLYFYQPPRRNKDFSSMNLVYKFKKINELDDKINYLNLDTWEFIFNYFKTSKEDEELDVKINDDYKNIINIYLKFHPLITKENKNKKFNIPFLVSYKGEQFKHVNSITNILNSIFGKKVGSSMLRHIYLSNKYNKVNEAMKEDAKNMSHSLSMQKTYIKN